MTCTCTCTCTYRWVAGLTEKLRDCLDGRNVEWVLQVTVKR